MLFGVLDAPHAGSTEDTQKRSLQLFTQWSPPFEFKAHTRAETEREASPSSRATPPRRSSRGVSQWSPFFDFDVYSGG
jgi:hypothetical protein